MAELKSHYRPEAHFRPTPQEATSLDEVSKGLASGDISRRKALRMVGGMLGGALVASIPGVAAAQEEICSYSACCSCRLRDDTGTTVRSKCFVMSTTSCTDQRRARLNQKCQERCATYAQKVGLSVAQSGTDCFEPEFGPTAVCKRSRETGVSGTVCGTRTCTRI